MWNAENMDVVFMETVIGALRGAAATLRPHSQPAGTAGLRRNRHTVMHAVPLGRDSPMGPSGYFKKAILESDEQWSQNKKLVDTRGKGVRRSIPKGFPYFAVDFGMDGGYAHVVEDEAQFPAHFGAEVIGGMLDLPVSAWLRPKPVGFEEEQRRVVAFCKLWADYDWTEQLDDPGLAA